eukprot:gene1920-2177_t
MVELRNDSKFISRLLAIGQSREIDMKNVMTHSLRKFPSPIATANGGLVKTPKCKLQHELTSWTEDCTIASTSGNGAMLLDGMAMLQTLKNTPSTFGGLAESVLATILSAVRIRSPDTYVFILILAHKVHINACLYFGTGSGNNRKIIDVDAVHKQLGSRFFAALIGFHTFTGCDSTSAFHGKGKVSLLKVLEEFPEFYDTLARLGLSFHMDSSTKRELETFVCRIYNQYHVDKVEDAHYNIFRLGKYDSDKMPCTKDTLKKHMRS